MPNGIVGVYIPKDSGRGVVKAINVYTKKNVVGKTILIEGRYISIYSALRDPELARKANLIPYRIEIDKITVFFYYSRDLLGFFREQDIEGIFKEIKEDMKVYELSNDTQKFTLDEIVKKLLERIASNLESAMNSYYDYKYVEIHMEISKKI